MSNFSNNNPKQDYTLRGIAAWGSKTATETEVSIPALQRGLVWKPGQVELLWDSIFRGFPIGSMMLSFAEDTPGQRIKMSRYFLLDGQQRMNAIAQGINGSTEDAEQPEALLWLDLRNMPFPKNSSREYWIRVCTPAHPWGYTDSDSCEPLPASDRRTACDRYGVQNRRPIPAETWPYKAELPIPLHILFKASSNQTDEETFIKTIIEELKKLPPAWNKCFFDDGGHEIANRIRKMRVQELFQRVNDYRVSVVYLPKKTYEESSEKSAVGEGCLTDIEVLFTRLNTQGTRISSADLFYSAITAYWATIKTSNESLAKGIMPPANLVMLASRLALTEGEGLHADITVAKLRRIKSDPAEVGSKEKIQALYGDEGEPDASPLKRIMTQVESWLTYHKDKNPHGLPPVLRVELALKSPDVYLLLLWLAREHPSLENKTCIGLSTLLHWFGINQREACNTILKSVVKLDNPDRIQSAIGAGLVESIQKGCLIEPLPLNVLEEGFRNDGSWNWEIVYGHKPCWSWLARVKENRSVLLYAQRSFLHEKFQDYNPSRLDLWEDYNRPWDIDHVIPQDWIGGKRGPYREYCKQWLNNIGNLAAISFEYNRSKGATDEWNVYDQNSSLLHYDAKVLSDIKKITAHVTCDKMMAWTFAEATKERFRSIYEDWYGELGLSISSLLSIEALPENHLITRRMRLFKRIKAKLRNEMMDAHCFYVSGNREFIIEDDDDIKFSAAWISVGVYVNEKCLVCLTSDGTKRYELGLRKGLQLSEIDKVYLSEVEQKLGGDQKGSSPPWWYECLLYEVPPEPDLVCSKIASWYTLLK